VSLGFEQALKRYEAGEFFDDDVTECTGLSVRAWRELIKLKAVQPIPQELGRGRGRKCDQTTFKRTAVIAAFHQAGFSLAMCGRLAYLLPFDHIIYDIYDPCGVLLKPEGEADPLSGLRPRREKPLADWFDPDKPAIVDPNDWSIEILDARFVKLSYFGLKPWVYGELHGNQTRFTSWLGFHRQGYVYDELRKRVVETAVAKWGYRAERANQIDPNFLRYRYEDHRREGDPLRLAALAANQNPLIKTTINISLAIRTALRRYLGIDPKFLIRTEDAT
jgi:hypothetical protein